jgi:hypothetical protein
VHGLVDSCVGQKLRGLVVEVGEEFRGEAEDTRA